MIDKAYSRYCAVQKAMETDEEYLWLEERRLQQDRRLAALLDSLPEEQKGIIIEYIGICAEQSERILEIACFVS